MSRTSWSRPAAGLGAAEYSFSFGNPGDIITARTATEPQPWRLPACDEERVPDLHERATVADYDGFVGSFLGALRGWTTSE